MVPVRRHASIISSASASVRDIGLVAHIALTPASASAATASARSAGRVVTQTMSGALVGDHLPQVGVERVDAPAPAEGGQALGVDVHPGHELDVARLDDRGGVGPRPRVVGLADVLVVDGAAHAPASDDGGPVAAPWAR